MMDTSDAISKTGSEDVSLKQVVDVGMTLRKGRERLGMSVHDVAERIKFAPKQVEALEANDFLHLPEAAFLRGFVRSYARVLELDEVALIAALPNQAAKQVVNKAKPVDVPFPTMQSLRRINVVWLAGALGVAIVLGLFVLMHEGERAKPAQVVVESVPLPSPDAAASAVADTEAQAAGTEPAQTAEPEKPPKPVEITEPEKPSEPVKVAEPEMPPKPVKAAEPEKTPEPVKVARSRKTPASDMASEKVKPAPEIAAASTPVADAKSVIPLEVLMRRPLHFVFAEAMWAEVIDARGAVLLSRNVPRGSEKWIGGPGRAPYDISISNPQKVKLYYKGKEIDLSAYAGMEMAHLKVK